MQTGQFSQQQHLKHLVEAPSLKCYRSLLPWNFELTPNFVYSVAIIHPAIKVYTSSGTKPFNVSILFHLFTNQKIAWRVVPGLPYISSQVTWDQLQLINIIVTMTTVLPVTLQRTGKSLQLVTAVESVKQSFHRLDQYQATLMMNEPPWPPIWVILQKSMAMVHSTKSQPSVEIRKPLTWIKRLFISKG